MGVSCYDDLRRHVGHKFQCVVYGDENVALECVTCCEVIIDFDKEYNNFHFVSDNAVVILTTDDEDEATAILRETVRIPQDFRLEKVEKVCER